MAGLPQDVIWLVLRHLPASEILRARPICNAWRQTVDRTPQHEWRRLYCCRVCSVLRVGEAFDWRAAAVRAAQVSASIDAECTWHKVCVRVSAPWMTNQTVEAPLRAGVVRSEDFHTHVVDYVYDEMFRLRGFGRSCLQRSQCEQCANCRSKRKCLFMRYDYYLRPLSELSTNDPTALDECLGLHLRDACMT